MNEVTSEAKMLIHRPVHEVYEAFANPEIMTKFWFPKATGRLETGKEVKWYVGTSDDAFGFAVRVTSANSPHSLHIQWGLRDHVTDVIWEFESQGDNATILRITESGFTGDQSQVLSSALDSTGGFNQVVTAAKALLEHKVEVNVVKDHVA